MKKRFQGKIAFLFTSLIAVIQLVVFTAVYFVIKNNAFEQSQEQLISANKIFKSHLDEYVTKNIEATKLIIKDFGFRQAVATFDQETTRSALLNLKQRVKADKIFLYTADGKIINDTDDVKSLAKHEQILEMLDQANNADYNSNNHKIVSINNHLYDLAIVPVLAPTPIAWVGIGNLVDSNLAINLAKLSTLDLSVNFVTQDKKQKWHILATNESSFKLDKNIELPDSHQAFMLGNKVATYTTLQNSKWNKVGVILFYDLDKALKPYHELFISLIIISVLGLIISVIFSFAISSKIASPVIKLANAAKKIAQGNYDISCILDEKDELQDLANAFDHMIIAINNRENTIIYQSSHDSLTGAINRNYFEKKIDNFIHKHGEQDDIKFAIVIVSIGRFDEINYTLGYEVGDILLQYIVKKIQSDKVNNDNLARISNDSFCVFLAEYDDSQALSLAKEIQSKFELPYTYHDFNIDVQLNIGVAIFPEHGGNADCLLRRADVAKYLAQTNMSHCVIYDGHIDPYNKQSLSIMGDFKHAIKHEELILHFQPKLDLRTNQILQAEVLVRWEHPTKGLIRPDSFINLAEQTGNIHLLTKYVLEKSAMYIASWREIGIDVNLAVNISTKDFLNLDIIRVMSILINDYNLRTDQLVLEITESSVMHDFDESLKIIQEMRGKGIKFSIDDYGTGYSSMDYIRKFPASELKIDRSFVQHLADSRSDQAIVKSTIKLGHDLGMEITAEGVENLTCLNLLRGYGCDTVQGYFISQGLPDSEFLELLNNFSAEQYISK